MNNYTAILKTNINNLMSSFSMLSLDKFVVTSTEALANKEKWNEKYKDWLEPKNVSEILRKNPSLRPANPVWLPVWELIRMFI